MAFSGITKFINQLTATESISDTDNLIVGNTDAKKITWAQIIALIKTKLNIGNTSLDGIGDGTLTGAVAELNSNLMTIDSDTITFTVYGIDGKNTAHGCPISVPDGYYVSSAVFIRSDTASWNVLSHVDIHAMYVTALSIDGTSRQISGRTRYTLTKAS